MGTVERLVLITGEEGRNAFEEIAGVRITQSMSPRVMLVVGSGGGMRRLRTRPGVEVIEGDLPARALEWLDPEETLFARAWLSGRAKPGVRHGEGLPWDAPGFEPPDPTHGG